jgi:hypothetical protein
VKKIIPDTGSRYEVWTSCQCFDKGPKPVVPVMRLSCAFSTAQMALSFAEKREDAGYVIEVIDTKDGSLVKASWEVGFAGMCG